MSRLTSDQMGLILIHLVRDPDTIRKSTSKLDKGVFNSQESFYQACWSVSRDYYGKYQQPIPRQLFTIELANEIYEKAIPSSPDEAQRIVNIIYEYPENALNSVHIIPWIQDLIMDRKTAPVIEAIRLGIGDPSGVVGEMLRVSREATMSSVPTSTFDLCDMEDMFCHQPLIQTNFKPLDTLLGGGIFINQAYGLLGPTGGGKTTLAQTLACEWAASGRNVAFFSYEEPIEDIRPRMILCMARKYRRKDVFGIKFSQLDQTIQKDLTAASQLLNKHVMLVDMAGFRHGHGGIIEMEAALHELCERDNRPTMVIVDHVHPMARRAMKGSGKADESLRHEIFDIADRFRMLTNELKFTGILINQVGAEANKRSNRQPTHTDSAECRTFAYNLHFCMNLGKPDKDTNIALFNVTKGRNAPENAVCVHIAGEFCRVRAATNYVPNTDGGGIISLEEAGGVHTAPAPDGSGRVNMVTADSEAEFSRVNDE
jgi:RecA/RadA recombinase